MNQDNIKVKQTELIKHNDKEYSFKEMVDFYLNKFEKVNHKIYRNVIKKVRRKYLRQKNGSLRDQLIQKFNLLKESNPEYKKEIEERVLKEEKEIEIENKRKEKEHQIWLERERLAQIEWQAKKEKLDREEQKHLEQQNILSKDIEILCSNQIEPKRQKIDNKNENNLNATHNPIVSLVHAKEADKCLFYLKTGNCKYGIRCAKAHDLCEKSSTLLFFNMYSGLQQLYSSLKEDYECDSSLEYEDREIYNHFKEFYNDVLNEFKNIGPVVQFKVCCNYQPHIRGNVYVQFKSEKDAEKAFQVFNGRYYAGRQIYCNFVRISSWREAICGLFLHKKCPKGRNCSFLHVFKDPDNEFRSANNDKIINENEIEVRETKIISYQSKEWSSPEVEREKMIEKRKVDEFIEERNKRRRSRSKDRSDENHRKHKKKKHKKKEHKKKKKSDR